MNVAQTCAQYAHIFISSIKGSTGRESRCTGDCRGPKQGPTMHLHSILYKMCSFDYSPVQCSVYHECAQNAQFTDTCRADSAHCTRQSTRGPMVEGGPACGRAAVELSYLDSRNGYRRVPRCCHLCTQAVTRSYLASYLSSSFLQFLHVSL